MSTKSVLSSSHPSIHAIADVLIHMPGPNHPKFKLQRQISDPMLGCLGHRYLPVSPLAATDITLDQKFSAVSLEKDIPVLSAPGSQILSRFAAKQLLSKRAMKRDHRTTKDNLEQMQTFSGSHPELYFTSHDLANFEWLIGKSPDCVHRICDWITTRAPSQYKDRLSQVWGFPC